MSINLSWYPTDSSVVLWAWTSEGEFNADEMVEAVENLLRLFDEAGDVTDVIIDSSKMGTPSGVISKWGKIMNTQFFKHPNGGLIVITGAGGYTELLTNTFVKFSGMGDRIRTASTVDEAVALIQELRAGG